MNPTLSESVFSNQKLKSDKLYFSSPFKVFKTLETNLKAIILSINNRPSLINKSLVLANQKGIINSHLSNIPSIIKNLNYFVCVKWPCVLNEIKELLQTKYN